MILEEIHIRNFLSHADSTVCFEGSPLWLIGGENGAGKSALFDAVEYSLYGNHRGERQNSALLVKHGTERATIRVVVCLDGARYRLTHSIHHERGNAGGTVERWSDASGSWQPLNVGDGRRATWEWTERRLPSVDQFRSAIFLRQGQAAHFFGGSAAERTQRFATLVDLSQYTRLAERARGRSSAAGARLLGLEGQLQAQGDVSDGALADACRRLEGAGAALDLARRAANLASDVRGDAETWVRLQAERQEALDERQALHDLLGQADEIRAAAEWVDWWDRAAAQTDRFWHRCQDAVEARAAAVAADGEASEAEEKAATQGQALQGLQARLDNLLKQELPSARSRSARLDDEVRALDLEVRIARARDRTAAASATAERYTGADERLASWRGRQAARPRLEALAQSRTAAEGAADEVAGAEDSLRDATAADQQAGATLAEAEAAARARVAVAQEARQEAERLRTRLDRLLGRVEGHGRLTGAERECPTCAQPLNEAAHAHVQTVLAAEREEVAKLEAAQEAARVAQATAEQALQSAEVEHRQAQTAAHGAHTQLELTRQRLEQARRASTAAAERLVAARAEVVSHHGHYAQHVDEITAAWLEAEVERVKQGLAIAEREADALAAARADHLKADVELGTLRRQRHHEAPPLGETLPADDLTARVTALDAERRQAAELIERLEGQRTTLQRDTQARASEIATLSAQAAADRRRAQEAGSRAATADADADAIATALGERWGAPLASHEAFDAQRQEVDARRPVAARVSDLALANGQLLAIEAQLSRIAREQDEVPPEHRIPVEDAAERERVAREAELAAGAENAQAESILADLQRRRTEAIRLRGEIDVATRERQTYAELSDILKEGGPLQSQVAEQEQRRIVHEVNTVLTLLDDPLRVTLGDPRRQQRTPIKDVLITDATDPISRPRYFEFLSGGEQFRIALGLALALHRRVGKRAAGTIIVDEGFGMLDANRRDALALQMTDTSRGILQLGLAHSIIICSHSAEVQRRFPFRWLVTKEAGTATVSRPEVDDG
jgi:exonuclease SbcC